MAIHVPNGIFSDLEYLIKTNINPIIEARNKHRKPFIIPRYPPIKIVNRISPKPRTSLFDFINLTRTDENIKYNETASAPNIISIID